MVDKIKSLMKSLPLLLGILAFTGVLSFLLFLNENKRERLLFYPLDDMQTLDAELRSITHHNNLEDQMEELVRELLLHPVDVRLNPIVPEDVVLHSIIYDKDKRILFVDISDAIVLTDRSGKRFPEDRLMLEMLERNIRFHYPKLSQVFITVDGMVPFKSLYQ